MLFEDLLAVRVALTKGDCFPTDPPRGKGEAADAAEQVEVAHGLRVPALKRSQEARDQQHGRHKQQQQHGQYDRPAFHFLNL